MILGVLFFTQVVFLIKVLIPLLKAINRQPPILPHQPISKNTGKISVIIPTLNEAKRIKPCLEGIINQGPEVREILIVDSNSNDGTREIVKEYNKKDARIKLLTDDPLPAGWIGRPWALHFGFKSMSKESKWFLGLDADTLPQEGMASGILKFVEENEFDLVSFGPRFILKSPGEIWLQPALLVTLIYRFGAPGSGLKSPIKTLANGQLFLARKTVLEKVNGYHSASSSFCDDVTLARNIAKKGFKVSFMDGSKVYKVRMYEGLRETWSEWGRSLDLKDATTKASLYLDVLSLLFVQGLPIVLLVLILNFISNSRLDNPLLIGLLCLNLFILLLRYIIQIMIKNSYDLSNARNAWIFWLSPLADPLAFLRILISSFRRPKSWRGRLYR